MDNKPIFLSGLNGIRTIAAFGVLISHINLSLGGFGVKTFSLFGFNKNGGQEAWVLGEHGVTIFFVLSGFLITYLLLKEYEKTNTIKIKEFYIRRILRIWPLYYLYILLVLVTIYSTFSFDVNLFYYLTLFANIPFINGNTYPAMYHLWSISVEEQFYLFWPFLFLLFINRKFIRNLLLIIGIFSLIRIFIWYLQPFSIPALISVVNRFDCMLFGALGAFLVFKKAKIIFFLNNKIIQILAWLVMFMLILNIFQFINSIIEIFIIELITLIIIIGQINIKNRIVNLENKIMSYFGKLSFGIYVYHPLLILILSKISFTNGFYKFEEFEKTVIVFLLIIFFTIVVSHMSYYKYEVKFLKLKHKFSIIKSTNNKADV
jgi:peptidoglycan/LPS O-acetylase OafA/YrhL